MNVAGLADALNGASIITLTGKVRTADSASSQTLLTLYAPSSAKFPIYLYRNQIGALQAMLVRSIADTAVYSNSVPRTPVSDMLWHAYGVELNVAAKTIKIFVDGIKVFSGAVTTSTGDTFDFTGESKLSVGYARAPYKGYYDDLRIYRRALSDEEHRGLFFDRAPRDGLAAEYKFDNDTTMVLDSSGNGLHGTWPTGLTLADYVQLP
jgi:hypothetical protein